MSEGGRLLTLGGALLAFACGSAPPRYDAAALTNAHLSPALSQWLVGPIARMAAAEEIAAFLDLRGDAAAERFIAAFWQRRDPEPRSAENEARELFEARVVEADRRFSEAGVRGRRTDRGAILVLYGEPSESRFEISRLERDPPLEVWSYDADAAAGLDGERPEATYRFFKPDDLTILYRRLPPRRLPAPGPDG